MSPVDFRALTGLVDVASRVLNVTSTTYIYIDLDKVVLIDLGSVAVEDLRDCPLEGVIRLSVYVQAVTVVRTKYRGQTQLQNHEN